MHEVGKDELVAAHGVVAVHRIKLEPLFVEKAEEGGVQPVEQTAAQPVRREFEFLARPLDVVGDEHLQFPAPAALVVFARLLFLLARGRALERAEGYLAEGLFDGALVLLRIGARQKQAHFLGQKFCAHLVHLGDVQPLQNVPAAEDGVDVAGIEPQLAQNIPRAAVVEGVFEDLVADDGENPVEVLPLVVRLGEHGVQKPKLGQKHLSAAAKAETHIIDGGVAVDFGAARGHFGIDFGRAALARPLEEHMLNEVVYPGRRLGHEGQDDGKSDRIQLRRAEGNQPRPVFQRLIFFGRKIHGIPSFAAEHGSAAQPAAHCGKRHGCQPRRRTFIPFYCNTQPPLCQFTPQNRRKKKPLLQREAGSIQL